MPDVSGWINGDEFKITASLGCERQAQTARTIGVRAGQVVTQMSIDTVAFDERVGEIESYIAFLESIERAAQAGPPAIDGDVVTTRQQRMLYSAVYLQLYNLVEATATLCVSAVTKATAGSGSATWTVGQLDSPIRGEWIRTAARTHVVLNPENRHQTSADFCDLLLRGGDILEWEIEKGGGQWHLLYRKRVPPIWANS